MFCVKMIYIRYFIKICITIFSNCTPLLQSRKTLLINSNWLSHRLNSLGQQSLKAPLVHELRQCKYKFACYWLWIESKQIVLPFRAEKQPHLSNKIHSRQPKSKTLARRWIRRRVRMWWLAGKSSRGGDVRPVSPLSNWPHLFALP